MCPYKSAYDTTFIVIRTAASGKTYVNRLYSETQTMLPIIPTSIAFHQILFNLSFQAEQETLFCINEIENILYGRNVRLLMKRCTRTRRIVSVIDHDVLSDRNPIERNKTTINIIARIVPTLAVILLFITCLSPSFL